jgi:hypothetical protein
MKNIKYIGFLIIILFFAYNVILLNEVKTSLHDTFFAYDVFFVEEDDNYYTMEFNAYSAQEKAYDNNDLVFFFKCYDEKGILLDDSVQALVKKGNLYQYQSYKSDISNNYASRINYCELNFVRILK